jgi:hypothetical protein
MYCNQTLHVFGTPAYSGCLGPNIGLEVGCSDVFMVLLSPSRQYLKYDMTAFFHILFSSLFTNHYIIEH